MHKGTKVTAGAIYGLVASHLTSPRRDDHPDLGLSLQDEMSGRTCSAS